MGRKRRRKVVTRPKPSLPDIFECPACARTSVRVTIDKKTRTALVECGACKIRQERRVRSIDERVDIFGDFLDEFYESRQSIG